MQLYTEDLSKVFEYLIEQFYYLRDYTTPEEKITEAAEKLDDLNNMLQEKIFDNKDLLSLTIKDLVHINSLFGTINKYQLFLIKYPTDFNRERLHITYSTLVEKLEQYSNRTALFKQEYSRILPKNITRQTISDHDQDVRRTIYQVNGEKNSPEEIIHLESSEHRNRPI